jgi:hypothetical protein
MKADCHGMNEGVGSAPRTRVIAFFVVCVVVFPVVLGLGMVRGVSHDEHQHVAAGALIAREGLMPYQDFPHFHTPYLAFLYALLFRMSDHLLVAGRLVSVLSATAILGILGSIAYSLFRDRGKRFAVCVCSGVVLLAMTTTLFGENTGLAWNHEPSLVLALIAFVAHVAGLKSDRIGWFVASGALLGLAIGTRITCAPLMAPFGLALLFYPVRGWRWNRIFAFSGGLLVGLAGLLYFFAVVPEQAFFGNFDFARANIVYRLDSGEPRTMTILKKLRFFFKEIIRPDAALFLVGFVPVVAACLVHRGTSRRMPLELRFILWLLPFLLIGSFAPSPLFDQYFYPLVPFLLLAGLYAFASVPPESVWSRRLLLTGAAAVLLSTALGWRAYNAFSEFFTVKEWRGIRVHRRMGFVCADIPSGKVLTLAPIYPLEAGFSIYPSFATGPFAWRISPYLEPAKAARLRIISPTTLGPMLQAVPPIGVFTGFEETGEEPLIEYASRHGYQPQQPWADERSLWFDRRK